MISDMEPPRHERRYHFRGKSRPDRVLPIRFRAVSAGADGSWIAADTRNIGVGGAYIVTQPLAVSTQLTIELTLPTSDQTFALAAIVRWAADDGVGVQFVGIDVDVLLELNDYFATLT